MRASVIFPTFLAPLAVLALPATVDSIFAERQASPVKPAPCVRNPSTTVAQTEQRAAAFAEAFISKPDISKAFTFIAKDYIVSIALLKAQNGRRRLTTIEPSPICE